MKRFAILGILFSILLLRIPSFFEPYWYGDEGIYLAVGQAMQRGAVLYRDIWDNKPPLLYMIYAVVPTLLWAKISATIFVLGTVLAVHKFSKSLLTALATGILLSLPLLEGTIANAELYFTLPIVLGAVLIYKFIETSGQIEKYKFLLTISIGLLFTISFLLKVPAVFDFVGMFIAFSLIKYLDKVSIQKQVKFYAFVFAPFILTIIGFVIYFLLNNALGDFLIASFSQNASYVAVGTGPLSKLSNPLFIKGLMLIGGCGVLGFLYFKKRLPKELLFLSFWFGFSLYGALLSNRPYMHYLLQIVPPAIILFFHLISNIRKNLIFLVAYALIIIYLARMFTGAFALGTKEYYANWFDYLSERKSETEFINFFDSRTSNSYAIAKYLDKNSKPTDPIFVWGDASFVYVLSNRPPVTKFIQAHHLTTIPAINYDLIMTRLKKYQPKFIIISRPVHFAFPKLEEFVAKNYHLVNIFEDLAVYQNNSLEKAPIFNVHYL